MSQPWVVGYVSPMKTTTASADPKALHKLQELVREIGVSMMTTVIPDGALRSRPMVTVDFEEDGVIWFFTADDSGKADDLDLEHGVNLSYADPHKHRYVSVTGNANIVRDAERARKLWKSSLKTYFPRGLEDPHLALLAVRIETAEFWDAPSSKMVRFFTAAKTPRTGEDPEHGEHTKVHIRATPASG
jgi:general stress protein 26